MDWSYVAGFFDADGTTGFLKNTKHKYTWIKFYNTDKKTIEEIFNFIGYGHINSHKDKRYNKAKTIYTYTIGNHREVLKIGKRILPFSITKRKRLERVIDFIESSKWSRCNILKYITRKELLKLYWKQNFTIGDLAKKFGVAETAIRNKMNKFNIARRERGYQGYRYARKGDRWRYNILKDLTKEELERLYWDKKLSLRQIAEKLGVVSSSIKYRMKKFNIPTRGRGYYYGKEKK